MHILKRVSLVLTIVVLGIVLVPQIASAQCTGQSSAARAVCDGLDATGGGGSSSRTIDDTIKLVINVLSFIVGIAAVIMIIIGGFKYVTSQGDSNNINSAKNTILYAIIGLVVVALAQIIVRFVLDKAT